MGLDPSLCSTTVTPVTKFTFENMSGRDIALNLQSFKFNEKNNDNFLTAWQRQKKLKEFLI
jgi:hypothetical protein